MPDMTLAEIEVEYGFVFGTPDGAESGDAPEALTVVCSTPGCERMNRQTTLHADTVLPVLCGGCGHVLHCPHHATSKRTVYGGTLAKPTVGEVEHCTACKITLNVTDSRPVDPAAIPLAQILGR